MHADLYETVDGRSVVVREVQHECGALGEFQIEDRVFGKADGLGRTRAITEACHDDIGCRLQPVTAPRALIVGLHTDLARAIRLAHDVYAGACERPACVASHDALEGKATEPGADPRIVSTAPLDVEGGIDPARRLTALQQQLIASWRHAGDRPAPFLTARRAQAAQALFIVKPPTTCRGRGCAAAGAVPDRH